MRKMRLSSLLGIFLLLTILLTPIYSRASDYHLATTGDDDNASVMEAWVVNPAPRSPPEPVGRVIDVTTFGIDLADNDADDSEAVSTAIASAGDNCTLYFPAGVYNVRWVRKIDKANGLSIKGDGPTESILKRMGPFWREGLAHTYENLRASYATDCKILRIEDCRNMCIRDIGFDANGTPTFGGVGIKRPKRLYITNTRYVDSKEHPALFGKDRYAWCILGYEEGGRDIWFTDNIVEGLQVEMDSVDRVVVERNILKRSVKSPGIGFLSGNFSRRTEHAKGYSNTNITVRNNYFSNSRNLSMGMVTFQLDPATNCNSVFRNIRILDNVFVYDIDSSGGHAAIKLGAGDSSLPTKGNVFEEFRIEGNRIYRKPDVNIVEKFNAYIWYNCWAGEHRLNRSVIRNNVLYTDTETKPLLNIGRKDQSIDLIIEDNHVRPYQPPSNEPARRGEPSR